MPFRPIRDLMAATAMPVAGAAASATMTPPAPLRSGLPHAILAIALTLFLPWLLAACAPGHEAEPAQATAAADEPMLSVRGQIRLPAGAILPDGADIQVTLVNTLLADTSMAVLARQSLEQPTGSRIAFALEVPAARVEARMIYALSALVRDRGGRVLFVTDFARQVDPGQDEPVTLTLVSVAGPDDADGEDGSGPIHLDYDCQGRTVHAIYASDRLTLSFPDTGQSLLLPAAISASGARFAIDGNEFWGRGKQASLTLAGQRRVTCHELARSPDDRDTDTAEPVGEPAGNPSPPQGDIS